MKNLSNRRCRIYTPEEAQYLRNNHSGRTLVELTEAFNARFNADKTVRQIRTFLNNRGLATGITGRFVKNHQPWNKGTKGQGMTGANCKSFKKGHAPANRKPLWSERIGKSGFIEMKVPERNPYTGFPTRYKHKHVWIWEQAHGPVPSGHVVAFLDGDNRNFGPDNLTLLTRTELLSANLHGYKDQPTAVKPSVLALAKLEARAGFRICTGRHRRNHSRLEST